MPETNMYEKLAQHLDNLPGGYPQTESGVEIRILRRLFAPAEVELALHLTLISEEPRVVAYRAKIPLAEAAQRLDEMARKGLIYSKCLPGKPPEYAISQFVIGIWEYQVDRLSRELVEDFEEYLPILNNAETWRKAPQLRTIPIGESIAAPNEVMPYENAIALVQKQSTIVVAKCICRQEMQILEQGCNKPLETCLTFGSAAHFYLRIGRGREINQEEALAILHQADTAGLVLQPGNSKEPLSICACCGCCCGVLRSLKLHPQPGRLVASPFIASLDQSTCAGCGICEERCPMDALILVDGLAVHSPDRCIGCGLCVTTCTTSSITLIRKPETEQPQIPKNTFETYVKLGQARGRLGLKEMASLLVQSKRDRLVAPKGTPEMD